MCMLCFEVAKGNVEPKRFWNLYTEIVTSDDPEHANGLLQVINKLPIETQEKYAEEATKSE